ncbi:MAG: hypothetical protein ABIQ61_03395 [Ornithinibacter sp.]
MLIRTRRHAGTETVAAYVAGNLLGQSWLLESLGGARFGRAAGDAMTYAVTEEGAPKVREEAEAGASAGLPIRALAAGRMPCTPTTPGLDGP